GAYYETTRPVGRQKQTYRRLIAHDYIEGRAPMQSFPAVTFELAILSALREIKPQEIVGGKRPEDLITPWANELARVRAEKAEAEAFMEAEGFSPAIGKRIKGLESREKEIVDQLAEARHEAAHPVSDSWRNTHTLIDALAKAPDPQEARIRL